MQKKHNVIFCLLFVFFLFVCSYVCFQFWVVLEEYGTKWQIKENNVRWSLFLWSRSGRWLLFLTVAAALVWKGFPHLEGFTPAGTSLQFSLSASRANVFTVFAELGNTSPAVLVRRNLLLTGSIQTREVRECSGETQRRVSLSYCMSGFLVSWIWRVAGARSTVWMLWLESVLWLPVCSTAS